ncbi:hypothetical protein F5Y06DRAFT_300035 [Hypoxylon sp. FL0890]|nr:hypothetical protein F5Y06DRAFT_300035 [Hypoxylon sp. FL0890]
MSPFDDNGSFDQGDFQTLGAIADSLGLEKPSNYKDDLIQRRSAATEEPLFHHRRAQLAYLILSELPSLKSMTIYSTDNGRYIKRRNTRKKLSLPALKHAKFVGFSSRDL